MSNEKGSIQRLFRQMGDKIFTYTRPVGAEIEKVPAGYYKVDQDPFGNFYLVLISDTVTMPEKVYGDAPSRCERVWDMYNIKSESVGVALFGKKGAGKTLLANMLANRAISEGYPVIDVSGTFSTHPDYLDFLNSIGDSVVIFDEFLKHLSKSEDGNEYRAAQDRQDNMLTFFSGTNNSKRLTIVIDNNDHLLSQYFRDRPSRIRYIYRYDGLEDKTVMQLAEENGLGNQKTEMLRTYNIRNRCTFDMISEIIFEWKQNPSMELEELTDVLNVPKLSSFDKVQCRVIEFENKQKESGVTLVNELAETDRNGDVTLRVSKPNPLFNKIVKNEEEFYNRDYDDYCKYDDFEEFRKKETVESNMYFGQAHLTGIRGNKMVYENGSAKVVVEEMSRTRYNASDSWGFGDEGNGLDY